jgi:hypothetical protein
MINLLKFILIPFRYSGIGFFILVCCIIEPFVQDAQRRKEAQERGEF